MRYEIKGKKSPVLEVILQQGESIAAEVGSLAWMTEGLDMAVQEVGAASSNQHEPFVNALTMVRYTCKVPKARLTLATEVPSTIEALTLEEGQSVVVQQDALLSMSSSVRLQKHEALSLMPAISNQSLFNTLKLSGPGTIFLEFDGEAHKVTLSEGETILADPGHVVVHSADVDYEFRVIKDMRSALYGGEGLYLIRLSGTGVVWMQSNPFVNLSSALDSVSMFEPAF